MDFLKNLEIDIWYKLILYLGVLFISISLTFELIFLVEKHLFGLGFGMLLIGISFSIAEKSMNRFKEANLHTGGPGFFSWTEIHHNFFSIVLLVIGISLSVLFGFLIIQSLL